MLTSEQIKYKIKHKVEDEIVVDCYDDYEVSLG